MKWFKGSLAGLNFLKREKQEKEKLTGAAGFWEDEENFLEAVRSIQSENRVFTTFTPFPVHGLEEAMKIKRSWIPWVTFFGGLFGFLFGLWFTWWTSARSWPLIVGGKPFWSLPAFIPVIFELTILFAALSSIAALLYACRMPRKSTPLDPDLTSHKFAVFVFLKEGESLDELKNFVQALNPMEIVEKEV